MDIAGKCGLEMEECVRGRARMKVCITTKSDPGDNGERKRKREMGSIESVRSKGSGGDMVTNVWRRRDSVIRCRQAV